MNKNISKTITALILSSMTLLLANTVSAASPTISAKAEDKVYKAGDTVEISIHVAENPGFVSMALILEYDSNYFTLMEAKDAGVIKGNKNDDLTKDPFGMYWNNDLAKENFTVNGDIIKLTFEVKEDIPSGTYTFGLTTPRDGILNYDIDNVDFELQGETISVNGTSVSPKPTDKTDNEPPLKVPEETKETESDQKEQEENKETKPPEKEPDDSKETKPPEKEPDDSKETKPVEKAPNDDKETKPAEKEPADNRETKPTEKDPENDGSRREEPSDDRDDDLKDSLKEESTEREEDEKVENATWENPFYDVHETDPYYQAIGYVYENGLFKGMSAHTFSPASTMNRAMFVTVLGRVEKVSEADYMGESFADVESDMWYTAYVKWASAYGIVQGYNKDRFGTLDEITIEQAMVIIARYASFAGVDRSEGGSLQMYSDQREVSDWAREAVSWCIKEGIYKPERRELNPQSPAPRWLVASMLHQYVLKFGTAG